MFENKRFAAARNPSLPRIHRLSKLPHSRYSSRSVCFVPCSSRSNKRTRPTCVRSFSRPELPARSLLKRWNPTLVRRPYTWPSLRNRLSAMTVRICVLIQTGYLDVICFFSRKMSGFHPDPIGFLRVRSRIWSLALTVLCLLDFFLCTVPECRVALRLCVTWYLLVYHPPTYY